MRTTGLCYIVFFAASQLGAVCLAAAALTHPQNSFYGCCDRRNSTSDSDAPAPAESLLEEKSLRSSRHILDNGLTAVITEMPSSPMVSVYALVKAGSATEGKFLGSGISHFLEHMLFKGTERRGVGEIAAEIQAAGGTINASTSLDHTLYTVSVPAEAFDKGLDVLADMLMRSKMDPQEVEKEREVVFGEMRLYVDDPARRLSELAFQNVYLRHPYRHPVIGYESLFAQISRDDIVEYHRMYYAPNNIVLSIVGQIQTEEVLGKIKDAFKDFKRAAEISRNLPTEPRPISPRRYEEAYATDLTRFSLTFPGVSMLDRDMYALDVLALLLGQGGSSRLYLDVYKKRGLVHSITASNFTPVDRGVFEIEAMLDEKNLEEVVTACFAQVNLVREKGITRKELEKAKRQFLSGYILSRQTSSYIAATQAYDEAFIGDYNFWQKYVEAVRNVRLEDIQRVAEKYLIKEASTLVVLRPKKPQEEESQGVRTAAPGEVKKYVLDNGLTVLLREDHTFSAVSVNLVLKGGTREETPELNGISEMTAAVWLKGTKRKSAEEIAAWLESLGIGISSQSGKNSFGIAMDFLPENTREAFDILEEFVKSSVFPSSEIEKVREDMQASIRQRGDDIVRFTVNALKETLFLTHPFRFEEEGSQESIARIQRKDILEFYQRLAVPGNIVISVFGDIDPQEILSVLKNKFEALPMDAVKFSTHREAPLTAPREKTVPMDKEQAMIIFGFHGTTITEEDRSGVEVMASILGSPFSGRMFSGIREQLGQAYRLGGGSLPGIDAGLIYFYVLTTPENIETVKELLKSEIQTLQSAIVTEEEIAGIKAYLKGTFLAGHETNTSLAAASGLDELLGLGFGNYRRYGTRIDAVRAEEIQSLAKKYLDLNKVAIVVVKPLDHETAGAAP